MNSEMRRQRIARGSECNKCELRTSIFGDDSPAYGYVKVYYVNVSLSAVND